MSTKDNMSPKTLYISLKEESNFNFHWEIVVWRWHYWCLLLCVSRTAYKNKIEFPLLPLRPFLSCRPTGNRHSKLLQRPKGGEDWVKGKLLDTFLKEQGEHPLDRDLTHVLSNCHPLRPRAPYPNTDGWRLFLKFRWEVCVLSLNSVIIRQQHPVLIQVLSRLNIA